MKKDEVHIALCKCKQGHRPFGVRLENGSRGWTATWAFPFNRDGTAERENYGGTLVAGKFFLGESYPGCPYCGAKWFVVCGVCGRLCCRKPDPESRDFTCDWCGAGGTVGEGSGELRISLSADI